MAQWTTKRTPRRRRSSTPNHSPVPSVATAAVELMMTGTAPATAAAIPLGAAAFKAVLRTKADARSEKEQQHMCEKKKTFKIQDRRNFCSNHVKDQNDTNHGDCHFHQTKETKRIDLAGKNISQLSYSFFSSRVSCVDLGTRWT